MIFFFFMQKALREKPDCFVDEQRFFAVKRKKDPDLY